MCLANDIFSELSVPLVTRSLGRWLVVATISCNLLVIGYSLVSLVDGRAQTEHWAEVQVQNMSNAISRGIANNIDKVNQSVRTIKYEMERQLKTGKIDRSSLLDIIGQQKESIADITGVRVISADGDSMVGHMERANPDADIARQEYFTYLKQTRGDSFIYSKPNNASQAGHSVFSVAYRVNYPDGRFAGMVMADMTIDHFKKLMLNFDMGKNGVLVLRDRDLSMFLRIPETSSGKDSGLGTTPPTSTLHKLVASGATSGTYRAVAAYDGAHRIFSYQKLPNAPMYVIAGLAEDDYLAQWRRDLWETVAFLLTFATVTALIGWLLYRTWRQQVAATEALKQGHESLTQLLTQLHASQHEIERLAFHDKLTGLPNRVMLVEQMNHAMSQAEHSGELLGVCYLDIDGFKTINDVWGHHIGDAALVEIASRLSVNMRPGDCVARLGGDEFVLLLKNMKHYAAIEQEVMRTLEVISQPVNVGNTDTQLTASIGISIYPDDIEDADTLIRRADQAMYIAKRSGKNQFHVFDSEADRVWREQHDLMQRIDRALKGDELRLYYQPKVDMLHGKVIGAEALIRWEHPTRGLLGPAEFLPVIENTQLAISLGEWVIRRALSQMMEWSVKGLVLPVSVNVSAFHLQHSNFVQRLSGLLSEHPNVDPKCLQIEILETSDMEDIDVVRNVISACGKLGVTFALDDFGTGYSSLTFFRSLPTDQLKIDRSFVRDMLNNPSDYALIESVVKLAQTFERQVIAEGVETQEQGLSLLQLGCRLGQGYGIARPMPPEEMIDWVANWKVPQLWREFAQGS